MVPDLFREWLDEASSREEQRMKSQGSRETVMAFDGFGRKETESNAFQQWVEYIEDLLDPPPDEDGRDEG